MIGHVRMGGIVGPEHEQIDALHDTVDNLAAARLLLEVECGRLQIENAELRQELLRAHTAPWWTLPVLLLALALLGLLLRAP
jgi:hypothetical protein